MNKRCEVIFIDFSVSFHLMYISSLHVSSFSQYLFNLFKSVFNNNNPSFVKVKFSFHLNHPRDDRTSHYNEKILFYLQLILIA